MAAYLLAFVQIRKLRGGLDGARLGAAGITTGFLARRLERGSRVVVLGRCADDPRHRVWLETSRIIDVAVDVSPRRVRVRTENAEYCVEIVHGLVKSISRLYIARQIRERVKTCDVGVGSARSND